MSLFGILVATSYNCHASHDFTCIRHPRLLRDTVKPCLEGWRLLVWATCLWQRGLCPACSHKATNTCTKLLASTILVLPGCTTQGRISLSKLFIIIVISLTSRKDLWSRLLSNFAVSAWSLQWQNEMLFQIMRRNPPHPLWNNDVNLQSQSFSRVLDLESHIFRRGVQLEMLAASGKSD